MADEQSASLNQMAPRTRDGIIQVWYLLPASTSKRHVQNTITIATVATHCLFFSIYHNQDGFLRRGGAQLEIST